MTDPLDHLAAVVALLDRLWPGATPAEQAAVLHEMKPHLEHLPSHIADRVHRVEASVVADMVNPPANLADLLAHMRALAAAAAPFEELREVRLQIKRLDPKSDEAREAVEILRARIR